MDGSTATDQRGSNLGRSIAVSSKAHRSTRAPRRGAKLCRVGNRHAAALRSFLQRVKCERVEVLLGGRVRQSLKPSARTLLRQATDGSNQGYGPGKQGYSACILHRRDLLTRGKLDTVHA